MDYPLPSNGRAYVASITTVTSSASAHTKGAWTAMSTSMPENAGIVIGSAGPNSSLGALIDIAVGAAGFEQVILENWHLGNATQLNQTITLPIAIPPGSRVSARVQYGQAGATSFPVSLMLLTGGLLNPSTSGRVLSYGPNTANSRTATVDPGGSAGTYGAWSTWIASAPADIVGMWVVIGNNGNTAPQNVDHASFRVDIGVGAAASEQRLLQAIPFGSYSLTGLYGPAPAMWLPCDIPAGARVAVRGLSSTTDATDRVFGLALYALTA